MVECNHKGRIEYTIEGDRTWKELPPKYRCKLRDDMTECDEENCIFQKILNDLKSLTIAHYGLKGIEKVE